MGSNQYVEDFIKKLENLYEVDYGDFKRKVGLYINQLENSATDSNTKKVARQIREVVVFNPLADVEVAREKALKLASQLRS